MNKKYLRYILLIIITFLTCTINIKAKLTDHSSGGTSGGSLSGEGAWSTSYVGLKVSVIDSEGDLEESAIFLNDSGKQGANFVSPIKPKTKQGDITDGSWKSADNVTTYKITGLPSNWRTSDDKNIDIHSKLKANDYELLKTILNKKDSDGDYIFSGQSDGDYILIEPMVKIGQHYGTAYELLQTEVSDVKNCSFGTWCYSYTNPIFGGNSNLSDGGLFWNTIYISSAISDVSLYNVNNWCTRRKRGNCNDFDKYQRRNACLRAKTCGRGIGVIEYNDIYPGLIKITKTDESGNKLKGAEFTLYSDKNCTTKIAGPKKTNKKGVVKFTGLKLDKKYYYKETAAPSGYIIDNECKKAKDGGGWFSNSNKKVKITIKNKKTPPPTPKLGNIHIIKQDENKKTITIDKNKGEKAAIFLFYNGHDCKGQYRSFETQPTGILSLTNLTMGNYSIRESSAPTGYVADTEKCYNITLLANENKYVYVQNKSACKVELEASKDANGKYNVTKILELYKKYQRRGLLNFTNPSCGDVTCNPGTNDTSISCLSANVNNTTTNFNSNNLSCYDEGMEIQDASGNYIGFCKKSLKLENKLDQTSFNGTAGQFLSKASTAASATSTKTCFILNGKTADIGQAPTVEVYFGDNNSDGDADKLGSNSTDTSSSNVEGSFTKYVNAINYNFYLRTVYLERLTGKVVANKTNSTIEQQGLIIPFNSPLSGNLPFEIKFGTEEFKNDSCKYTSTPELITYPPDNPKGELNLEFRTIDTSNPFPGKNGKTRITGSNWCDKENNTCSGDYTKNKIIEKNIINKNNSYNKTNDGALYTITLTPSTIKDIRNYNKDNPYDNYELDCDELGNCVNKFLNQFNITKVS